jgi:NitT/TauT family transport system permease protein
MVTIGVLGWLTSTAVELLGRRLTRWLPRTSYVPAARTRTPKRPPRAGSAPTAVRTEEARDEHLV